MASRGAEEEEERAEEADEAEDKDDMMKTTREVQPKEGWNVSTIRREAP